MSLPDSRTSHWMDTRVEPYVDDALPSDECAAFEERLADAPRWRKAVRRARRVQTGLQSLPQPASCPPDVTRAVLRRTRSAARPPRADRAAAPRRAAPAAASPGPRRWQPALALALLLCVAAAAALWGRPAPGDETFTRTEVQRAAVEAEFALALVAQTTRRAGETVRRDVLGERVAAPVRRAVLPVLDDLPDSPSPVWATPRTTRSPDIPDS